MFLQEKGDRPNVPNIGIVITDGESNRDPERTIPTANSAKDKGIILFSIGIGDQVYCWLGQIRKCCVAKILPTFKCFFQFLPNFFTFFNLFSDHYNFLQ